MKQLFYGGIAAALLCGTAVFAQTSQPRTTNGATHTVSRELTAGKRVEITDNLNAVEVERIRAADWRRHRGTPTAGRGCHERRSEAAGTRGRFGENSLGHLSNNSITRRPVGVIVTADRQRRFAVTPPIATPRRSVNTHRGSKAFTDGDSRAASAAGYVAVRSQDVVDRRGMEQS